MPEPAAPANGWWLCQASMGEKRMTPPPKPPVRALAASVAVLLAVQPVAALAQTRPAPPPAGRQPVLYEYDGKTYQTREQCLRA